MPNSSRAGMAFCLLGLLLVIPAPAAAQTRSAKGVLDGVVTDTSLAPIAGATAWIVGSQVEATTDARGRFRIVDLPANQYILLIRRIGYAQLSTAIRVPQGDTLRASFALRPATPVLDTVVATANRASSRLQEFEDRRAFGQGKFLTQSEIEKLNLVGTLDVLRTFSAFNGGENPRGGVLGSCAYQYFLDGVPLQIHKLDADLPPPGQLAGIELYVNSATVPLQYKTFGSNSGGKYGSGFCGAILLWTKSGQ